MSTLAVYDCMLFLRAAARPERTVRTFDLVRSGAVTLCLSPAVLAEIRDVLSRSELRKKFTALTDHAVDAFLTECLRGARWIENVPEVFALPRDPKDSKYVNLALAAGALFLVTTDLDLLDLMKPETTDGREFLERYPHLRILDPTAFAAEVTAARKSSSEGGTPA